ncbi:MAG: undecaprenyldiphospho-muramoylpentapeptide beta-N-acetylglucosaminyltransferase [Candidatus Binatia bacterium]
MTTHRVALAAGGTAGHVYPALAIARAFRELAEPVQPVFIGTGDGFEARIVPRNGYALHAVAAAPLFGVGLAAKVRAGGTLCLGIVQARRVLRAQRVDMVLGLGGYASASAVLAGWSLGLRTAVHEANIEPGLTNRFLARFADRAYVGFEATGHGFPRSKVVVTGNPVRPDVAADTAPRRPPPGGRPFRVLVTGGSSGAPFFNAHVPGLLEQVARCGLRVEVRHQTGDCDIEGVQRRYAAAGIPAAVNSYIDDMADVYRWADFAITRSGAATIAELAASGLPALLVPLPTAAWDHQTANAVAFAHTGSGSWVSEHDWQPERLAERIARLLHDACAWQAASCAAQRFAPRDAARTLVAGCIAELNGR